MLMSMDAMIYGASYVWLCCLFSILFPCFATLPCEFLIDCMSMSVYESVMFNTLEMCKKLYVTILEAV